MDTVVLVWIVLNDKKGAVGGMNEYIRTFQDSPFLQYHQMSSHRFVQLLIEGEAEPGHPS